MSTKPKPYETRCCEVGPECTEACAARPECAVCYKTKGPRGRSVPMCAANGYCDWDCPGYDQEPRAGHLWPSEWHDHAAGHPDDEA